jgi:uncharacterized protein (TIGR02231 family)
MLYPSVASADGYKVASVDFYPQGAKFLIETESDGRFSFSLPGSFGAESVRCLTQDHVTSLKVDTSYEGHIDPPELVAMELRVEDSRRALNLLEARRATLEQTRAFLQTPNAPANENWKVRLGADDMTSYIERAGKMRLDTENELVEVVIGLEHAKRDLDKAQAEYNDLKNRIEGKRGLNPDAVVVVRGTTDGTANSAKLLFEASTNAAGWSVAYEMALDSATGAIEAVMNAMAWQNCGIDISGEFSFHTRAPVQSVAMPVVYPLTVGLRPKPEPLARGGANKQMAAIAPEPMMAIDSYEMAEDKASRSRPDAIVTMTDVSVKGSGVIESDGSEVRIKLGVIDIESEPLIIAAPEQSREAWIVASVDVMPRAFLPGIAELSVDGASSGRTRMTEATAGVRVPFGMVSRITSKKEPFIGESGSSWIGGGTVADGYTIEVTNGMETAREVTVLDRVPVSVIDKVTVTVNNIDPKAERDKEGRLTWKLTVAPGETKKITVAYTIKYPGDEMLQYNQAY